jgi:predicted O-linked N-acetylglucosamine transferase (SPINDLY family)
MALDTLQAAIARMEAGQTQEAVAMLESICRSRPDSAPAWFAVGVAHHLLGRLRPALEAFEQARDRAPGSIDILNARGSVLAALGRPDEALSSYEEARVHAPRDPQVLTNIAIVLEAQTRLDAALARYDEALAVDPDFPAALLNRSALLLRLGRPAAALAATQRLVTAHPALPQAHLNHAEALLALDRYAEARAAAERAIALAPASIAAQVDRAVALACLGWFAASAAAFRLARATDPAAFAALMRSVWSQGDPARSNWPRGTDALPDPRAIYLGRMIVRQARCDWSGRADFLANLHRIVRESTAEGAPVCDWALPFASNWLPLDEDVRHALASAVGQAIDARTAASRLPPRARPRERPQRLRLGYITPDVRDHPNVSLTAPVLAAHDRSRHEVIGYALNPREESAHAARFRAGCDQVLECDAMDDLAVARRIRDDGIDILIDLAGYTDMARPEILALRPAPINCAYLGQPGTSGAPWMDYRISDPISTPPAAGARWSEQLALLDRTMFAYEPMPLPADPPLRASEGLPDDAFVFCCFHTANKIDPGVFGVWLRLLQRLPRSVLWLSGNASSEPYLRAEAAAQGIDAQRLVFARRLPEKADHLNRQRLANLFLDTPAYNAHTTAVEALLAGLPVLTCTSTGPASRVGASILHAAGLPQLIAPDLSGYEARALALASRPEELAALRADWVRRRAASRLFDARDLAASIERCYARMWARHARGLPPSGFRLDEAGP